MVTESLIRKKFVHQTVMQGLEKIRQQWRPAAAAFGVRTGTLRRFADRPSPQIRMEDARMQVQYAIPLHMRFLDIRYGRGGKKRGIRGVGQRNLYNKIVWPILYKEVFPELKYGFSEEVRRQVREQLEKAMNP